MLGLARVGGKSYFWCIAKPIQPMRSRVPGAPEQLSGLESHLVPQCPPFSNPTFSSPSIHNFRKNPKSCNHCRYPFATQDLTLLTTCTYFSRVFSTSPCRPRHRRKEIKVRVIERDIPLEHSWQYERTIVVMLRVIIILRNFYVFIATFCGKAHYNNRSVRTDVSSVSWNYGGSKPSGEVAEKKTEGEVAVTSKKGNTIKRKGEPENPAVAIAREGNDVVKKQSELTVEEKAGEEDAVDEESAKSPKTGTKRARDDGKGEEREVKKSKGSTVAKTTPAKTTAGTGKRGRPAKPKAEGAEEKSNDPKKPRGRPKKEDEGEPKVQKEKKAPKAKATPKKAKAAPNGVGVGSRTRSRN